VFATIDSAERRCGREPAHRFPGPIASLILERPASIDRPVRRLDRDRKINRLGA